MYVTVYAMALQKQINYALSSKKCCVGLAPKVNFTNIFTSSFSANFLLPKKLQTQTVGTEKEYKTLFTQKKLLIKCW